MNAYEETKKVEENDSNNSQEILKGYNEIEQDLNYILGKLEDPKKIEQEKKKDEELESYSNGWICEQETEPVPEDEDKEQALEDKTELYTKEDFKKDLSLLSKLYNGEMNKYQKHDNLCIFEGSYDVSERMYPRPKKKLIVKPKKGLKPIKKKALKKKIYKGKKRKKLQPIPKSESLYHQAKAELEAGKEPKKWYQRIPLIGKWL